MLKLFIETDLVYTCLSPQLDPVAVTDTPFSASVTVKVGSAPLNSKSALVGAGVIWPFKLVIVKEYSTDSVPSVCFVVKIG